MLISNKKGVGTFIAEFLAVILTLVLIFIFSIIFQLTVESRTYRIQSNFNLNDLDYQIFSYLRTSYKNSDVADNIILECSNNEDFSDIKKFSSDLSLPERLKISIECKNKKTIIKNDDCESGKFIEMISLNERDFIKINYC